MSIWSHALYKWEENAVVKLLSSEKGGSEPIREWLEVAVIFVLSVNHTRFIQKKAELNVIFLKLTAIIIAI